MKKNISDYEKVLKARDLNRPHIDEFINNIFDEFIELKGDRLQADDESILGGVALLDGIPVTVIGQKKGREANENIRCNFGMTSPEGYRKSIRLMRQAEKFNRPVVTFIDTPGAYPGKEAEMHGQSLAIAECMSVMSDLKVPIISIITGEGNSGGALALMVSDKIWMLENAVFAILSPEGFASILWKDATRADEASELMNVTADKLLQFNFIDKVINEDKLLYKNIAANLKNEIRRLLKVSPEVLISERYDKFRNIDRCGRAVR
ncbi:MAG: acetyl-CoA carboxylase carboxyl transferase subunit alpha [Lachnospiraceae bacterium]|nr:acetyl-CoA carboxylase carboxyl transferase subunit alpha [Lachnospiraceae bacterium]